MIVFEIEFYYDHLLFLHIVNHFVLIGRQLVNGHLGNIFNCGVDLNSLKIHFTRSVILSCQENLILISKIKSTVSRSGAHQVESAAIRIGAFCDVHDCRIIKTWTKNIGDYKIFGPSKMQFFILFDTSSRLTIRDDLFAHGRVDFDSFVDALGNLEKKVVF